VVSLHNSLDLSFQQPPALGTKRFEIHFLMSILFVIRSWYSWYAGLQTCQTELDVAMEAPQEGRLDTSVDR